MDPELFKRWRVSESLLQRAFDTLPAATQSQLPAFERLCSDFSTYLQQNEHELALDMLQELGELLSPRDGYWADLVRAAENMRLHGRVQYFNTMQNEALRRLANRPSVDGN
jgi:hypothetical protein